MVESEHLIWATEIVDKSRNRAVEQYESDLHGSDWGQPVQFQLKPEEQSVMSAIVGRNHTEIRRCLQSLKRGGLDENAEASILLQISSMAPVMVVGSIILDRNRKQTGLIATAALNSAPSNILRYIYEEAEIEKAEPLGLLSKDADKAREIGNKVTAIAYNLLVDTVPKMAEQVELPSPVKIVL